MSFVLFLRGFIGVLVVFAIATYVATQSLWTTLINTIVCAIIIQAGYFVAVLAMIWRSPHRGAVRETARSEPVPATQEKDPHAVH